MPAEPEPALAGEGLGHEAAPGIADAQGHPVPRAAERHLDPGRAAVPDRVLERLLHHAVEHECRLARHVVGPGVACHFDRDFVARAELGGEAPRGRQQAELVEARWVELVRDAVQVGGERPRLVGERRGLELVELDREQCQPLPGVVVEVACDAAALLLLRGDEPPRELMQPLLGSESLAALEEQERHCQAQEQQDEADSEPDQDRVRRQRGEPAEPVVHVSRFSTAKLTSSAEVRSPSDSIIRYLWNATVRVAIPSSAPISFMVRPSASSLSTSRSRSVSCSSGRSAIAAAGSTSGSPPASRFDR